jgi:flagellar biosynthesis protein FlhG
VIVVVTNDPASLTDAYALIKVLNRERGIGRVQVLTNMVASAAEAKEIYESLRRVAEKFLDVTLNYMGSVPYDEWLKRAVRRQRAVVDAYPSCPSAKAFVELAGKADRWSLPQGARGHLEFFVERLVQRSAAGATV